MDITQFADDGAAPKQNPFVPEATVTFPSLDAPEAVIHIDAFIGRPNLAGIERFTLQPRDVVGAGTRDVAPVTRIEIFES